MQKNAVISFRSTVYIPKKIREKAGFLHPGPVLMRVKAEKIIIVKEFAKMLRLHALTPAQVLQ